MWAEREDICDDCGFLFLAMWWNRHWSWMLWGGSTGIFKNGLRYIQNLVIIEERV